jgi:hypothetical protein
MRNGIDDGSGQVVELLDSIVIRGLRKNDGVNRSEAPSKYTRISKQNII